MTAPDNQPRWRAMAIGPGGVPAEQVTAVGAWPRPAAGSEAPEAGHGPSAVFGSFDGDNHRPSRRAGLGWIALAVVVAILVAVSLWSSNSGPDSSSGGLRAGDCLTSSGGQAVIPLDCSATDAEFEITALYPDSSNSERCSAVSSDVVLVTRDPSVLCLNYLASVGECLYAGPAVAVGKAACRTPGSGTTPTGLFRVLAVLPGTLDVSNCPAGTLESLVHLSSNEVVCLGMP